MSIRFLITNDKIDCRLADERDKFEEMRILINEKKYKVADTGLTYRQASYINKNILEDDRKNKQGWRKFSLKEVIYLSLVQELRLFGLNDNQLINLKKSFFSNKYIVVSDLAILLVLQGIKIHLIIDNNFGIGYFNTVNFNYLFEKDEKAYINLNFNEFVNDVWEKLGKKRVEYKNINDLLGDNIVETKDKKMIDLVKQKGYKEFYYKTKTKGEKE